MFQYLNSLDLAPVFSIEEFKHWFIPRKGIVDSYVVEVCFIISSVGQKKDAHSTTMQPDQASTVFTSFMDHERATGTEAKL